MSFVYGLLLFFLNDYKNRDPLIILFCGQSGLKCLTSYKYDKFPVNLVKSDTLTDDGFHPRIHVHFRNLKKRFMVFNTLT